MKKIIHFTKACRFAATIFVLTLTNSIANGQVSNVQCNPNGTLGVATDDYVTFSLQPTLPTPEFVLPYTYRVTATQNGNPVTVTHSDGSVATDVPYYLNYAMPFRLPDGSSANGPIVVTVTANWGSFTPTVYNVTNPGNCAATVCTGLANQTVTYKYVNPRNTTDLTNKLASIPKFDQTGGRQLTGVAINFVRNIWSAWGCENISPQAQTYRVSVTGNSTFKLAGSTIDSSGGDVYFRSAGYPATTTIGRSKIVLATGSWPGDQIVPVSPSNPAADTTSIPVMSWFDAASLAGMDPRLDPKWITTLTGDPTTDDDIFVQPAVKFVKPTTLSYAAGSPQFASFIGTGNVPLNFSTLIITSTLGGGGNLAEYPSTTADFEISLTYTYTDCPEGGPLPIKLESFTALPKGKVVQTQWKVADMINFSHFEVEHSADASSFSKIGNVAATAALQYSLPHNSPLAGNNFYRLKMVDIDGSYKYSPTVKVVFKEAGSVQIMPNPAVDFVNIQYYASETGKGTATWYNTAGQQLFSQQLIQGENKNINISALKSGLYMVHIKDAKGNNISIEKVLVQ